MKAWIISIGLMVVLFLSAAGDLEAQETKTTNPTSTPQDEAKQKESGQTPSQPPPIQASQNAASSDSILGEWEFTVKFISTGQTLVSRLRVVRDPNLENNDVKQKHREEIKRNFQTLKAFPALPWIRTVIIGLRVRSGILCW